MCAIVQESKAARVEAHQLAVQAWLFRLGVLCMLLLLDFCIRFGSKHQTNGHDCGRITSCWLTESMVEPGYYPAANVDELCVDARAGRIVLDMLLTLQEVSP